MSTPHITEDEFVHMLKNESVRNALIEFVKSVVTRDSILPEFRDRVSETEMKEFIASMRALHVRGRDQWLNRLNCRDSSELTSEQAVNNNL